jgi:hypothetical protein
MRPADQNPGSGRSFDHRLAHDGFRTVIESTCRDCHVSRLVSMADGSLEKWEREHKCSIKRASAHKSSA